MSEESEVSESPPNNPPPLLDELEDSSESGGLPGKT
jgi:hypothetical protein